MKIKISSEPSNRRKTEKRFCELKLGEMFEMGVHLYVKVHVNENCFNGLCLGIEGDYCSLMCVAANEIVKIPQEVELMITW
jgi:hypothetical protein